MAMGGVEIDGVDDIESVAGTDSVPLTLPLGLDDDAVADATAALEGGGVADTDGIGDAVDVGDTVSLGVLVSEELGEPLGVTPPLANSLGEPLATRVPPTTISYMRNEPPTPSGCDSHATRQQKRAALDAFAGSSPEFIIVIVVVSGKGAAALKKSPSRPEIE